MVTEMTDQEEKAFNAGVRKARALQASRETMAADGDVDGIWSELTRPTSGAPDPERLFPLLLRAIEVRSRRHPEEFSGEILAKIVSLTSYLALRSHYLLAARVEQYDRSPQGRGRVELPPAFADRVIPQLMALQSSLCEIMHVQASVARAWALARAKRAETDRAEGKRPAKAGGKTRAKTRRKTDSAAVQVKGEHTVNGDAGVNGGHHGDGKPGVNRVADLLNGLGSMANGVHHDD